MIGILYLISSFVSHIGATVRDHIYEINAPVDHETNTYIDFYGRRRDVHTKAYRYVSVENNRDLVIRNKRHEIVRNITAEKRFEEYWAAKNNPKRDPIMNTAFDTKEVRTTWYDSIVGRTKESATGVIYKDLDTEEEYYQRKVFVSNELNNKYFYVAVTDPYTLLRISDRQKVYEKIDKNHNKYNWLEHPEDEKEFITEYNNRPFFREDTSKFSPVKDYFLNSIK